MANHSAEKCMIFLHGAGANMYDLLGMIPLIKSLNDYHIFSLQAPYKLFDGSYCWFNLKPWMIDLLSNYQKDFIFNQNFHIEEFNPTLIKLSGVIDYIAKKHSQVSVLGFSQGGMMVASLILSRYLKHEATDKSNIDKISTNFILKKIVLLSTTLADYKLFMKLNEKNFKNFKMSNDLDIIQFHGKHDQVIACQWGLRLSEILAKLFSSYSFNLVDCAHNISDQVCKEIDQWLQK